MNRIKKLLAFCLSLTMICGAALSVNAANSVGLVTVRTDFSSGGSSGTSICRQR